MHGKNTKKETVYHIVYTAHLYPVIVQKLFQQYALYNDFYIVWQLSL